MQHTTIHILITHIILLHNLLCPRGAAPTRPIREFGRDERAYDIYEGEHVFLELRRGVQACFTVLCFGKGQRVGGSLGKIGSFSPVLLQHGIGWPG